jgi:hypothetical protein
MQEKNTEKWKIKVIKEIFLVTPLLSRALYYYSKGLEKENNQ